MKSLKILAVIAIGVFAMTRSTSRPNLNVRNNNPLNIRFNERNDWVGQIGQESGFVVFDSVEHGFRAAYKIVNNYKAFYGARSIRDIISRWAPPVENHTEQYIEFVSNRLDVDSEAELQSEDIPQLLLEMAEFEGARGAFDILQVSDGIRLA